MVVLNLNTPSALLGFHLGGIVGHRFLSKYRVTIDLENSVLGLKQIRRAARARALRAKGSGQRVQRFPLQTFGAAGVRFLARPPLLVGLDQQRRHLHARAISAKSRQRSGTRGW